MHHHRYKKSPSTTSISSSPCRCAKKEKLQPRKKARENKNLKQKEEEKPVHFPSPWLNRSAPQKQSCCSCRRQSKKARTHHDVTTVDLNLPMPRPQQTDDATFPCIATAREHLLRLQAIAVVALLLPWKPKDRDAAKSTPAQVAQPVKNQLCRSSVDPVPRPSSIPNQICRRLLIAQAAGIVDKPSRAPPFPCPHLPIYGCCNEKKEDENKQIKEMRNTWLLNQKKCRKKETHRIEKKGKNTGQQEERNEGAVNKSKSRGIFVKSEKSQPN